MNNLLDIGTLKGKILIFGGAYSNLQATEALLAVAVQEEISSDRIFCTGDSVGYCGNPEEVVQLLKQSGLRSIAGNVELNLRDEADDCGCNFNEGSRCDLFSKMWYPFAQKRLSDSSMEWIQQLPDQIRFQYAGKRIHLLHGSARNVSEFVFLSSPEEVKQHSLSMTGADVVVAGHCGIPFEQTIGEKTWLNAGVIGMPANDGTPRVWYLILDDTTGTLTWEFKVLDYDFKAASNAMTAEPLPPTYAQTLKTGIWDNMEILPEKERLQQGIPLTFSTIDNLSTLTR